MGSQPNNWRIQWDARVKTHQYQSNNPDYLTLRYSMYDECCVKTVVQKPKLSQTSVYVKEGRDSGTGGRGLLICPEDGN